MWTLVPPALQSLCYFLDTAETHLLMFSSEFWHWHFCVRYIHNLIFLFYTVFIRMWGQIYRNLPEWVQKCFVLFYFLEYFISDLEFFPSWMLGDIKGKTIQALSLWEDFTVRVTDMAAIGRWVFCLFSCQFCSVVYSRNLCFLSVFQFTGIIILMSVLSVAKCQLLIFRLSRFLKCDLKVLHFHLTTT